MRYFRYGDEMQKNIEEKKLKDQLVFKNQAEARASTEEATLDRPGRGSDGRGENRGGQAYITKKQDLDDALAIRTDCIRDAANTLAGGITGFGVLWHSSRAASNCRSRSWSRPA